MAGDADAVAWWSPAATREQRRREVEEYFAADAATYGERLADVLTVELAIVDALPEGPFRYVEALASREDARRRGHGRAVLGPGLARCADQGVLAALDTTPNVVAFYERLGFGRVTEVHAGDSPPAIVLTREPGRG